MRSTKRWWHTVPVALFCALVAQPVQAREFEGHLGVGVRGGVGVLTQDIDETLRRGKEGVVGAQVLYGLTDHFKWGGDLADFFLLGPDHHARSLLVGLNVEWENHNLKENGTGFNYGQATTISVLPIAELHVTGFSALSPYFFLGVGLNLNSFTESTDLRALAACNPPPPPPPPTPVPTPTPTEKPRQAASAGGSLCEISPKNTVAVKLGGGLDYFVTPHLALNAEMGWKWNAYTVRSRGLPVAHLNRLKTSNASFLLGLRYHF